MFIPFMSYWHVIRKVIKQQKVLQSNIWKDLILFQKDLFIVEIDLVNKLEKGH